MGNAASTSVATSSYLLDTAYTGATFFNGWNFITGPDPTHGFVQYLSQPDAQSAGLISQSNGVPAFMGVDYTTFLSTTAAGRKSVRIESQKSWTHGLFIADIAHMPDSTCGVWPAYWMFGPNWPNNGEVDIIEGVSRNTKNLMSAHTSANCLMTAGPQSGTTQGLNCDGSQNGNEGCGIASNDATSYGTGFNNVGGGVYATEWTSNYIQTWFFPRNSIPADITSGSPNPSGWGTPQSSFQGGSGCNIDSHFANQHLVFDTTFCGDWAGNVWGQDSVCTSLSSSCVNYVAGNPSAFTNTYWKVNSVKVYTLGTTPTTSTSTITKTSTITSAQASTSTTTVKPTTLTTSTKPTASPTWSSLGCYSDLVNGRALPYTLAFPSGASTATVELCQAACKNAGFAIAGLEYAQECWCGNAFGNGGARLGPDGTNSCTMRCKGNANEWCGGSKRLSAWKYGS